VRDAGDPGGGALDVGVSRKIDYRGHEPA
jgi:hypothetical protein